MTHGSRRSLIVVPAGATGLEVGGGHRTALFERALEGFGPVDVVTLSARYAPWSRPGGVGAGRCASIPTSLMPPRSRSRVRQGMRDLGKLLDVRRTIRPDPDACAALRRLLDGTRYDLAVFRFFASYVAVAEVFDDPGLSDTALALDLDDRDDQKYEAAIRSRLGANPLASLLARRMASRIRAMFRTRLPRLDRVYLVSDRDRLEGIPVEQVLVPNVAHLPAAAASVPPPAEGRHLLFVGGAGHSPNVEGMRWFLRDVLPRLRKARPAAEVALVGTGDWRGALGALASAPGLMLRGRVEDLAAEYARARAVIVPTRSGGGSKIKLVEAAGYGRPVICTTHAMRGFEDTLGRAIAPADTPGDFARACLGYLSDPAAADADGRRNRDVHDRSLSADGMARRLRESVATLLEGRPDGRRAKAEALA